MSEPTITWRDRLRYRFENTLSRGTIAIIGWLAVLSLLIVLLAAIVLALLAVPQDPADPASTPGLIEGAWQSLMHAMDAGNLAGDQGWGLRAVMLFVTIGGIFILSTLIGTLTSGLQTRLDELRKGRSRVIESGHLLILGWNSKIHSIISELIEANANQSRPRLVILAERDKVEMEDELRSHFPDTGRMKLICRSGNPLDLDDLNVVAPQAARAIVVLAPEQDNPDIHVIKSVLALTNHPQRRVAPYQIVAEIRDTRNMEAAELVGGNEAVYVRGDELIARVTAQTCRQSGLSVVYTELLDFAGSEFYFKSEPALIGRPFRETLDAYPKAAVMGIVSAGGEVMINPPMDRVLSKGEQLIVVAEDDDLIALAARPAAIQLSAITEAAASAAVPERTLVLGWNIRAEAVIRELDHYVVSGSEVVVLCGHADAEAAISRLSKILQHQSLRLQAGEFTSRAQLDAMEIARFQHIIVLSDPGLPVQQADAQTLIALLHLRRIVENGGLQLSIVSEMMDLRNRALAQVAKADDFIVSDKLVSLMLSQLAENPKLDLVFRELFAAQGSEIYIRPMTDYVCVGTQLDFHTLIEAAARRGEIAIGYRQIASANDPERSFGVRLNPYKPDPITVGEGDRLIVLAQQ